MPRKVINGNISQFVKSPKKIIETNKRVIPNRFQAKSYIENKDGLIKQIADCMQTDNDYYLGFGGVGDAILLLASCWNNPRAKVIFFGNGDSIPLIVEFFRVFGIPHIVNPNIMGNPIANAIYNMITNDARFKTSAHLADRLDYGDWKKDEKYIPRIINSVPWKNKFGTINKKVTVIAPHGSNHDIGRQRFLTPEEHNSLIEKHEEVYSVGSVRNLEYYGFPKREGHYWLTSDSLTSKGGLFQKIDMKQFLRIINSAYVVFSMDTWVKTYSALVGIPTTVMATRWHGGYREYGADATDYVFLNPKIWKNITISQNF